MISKTIRKNVKLQHGQQIGEASETKRTINRKAEKVLFWSCFATLSIAFLAVWLNVFFDVECTSQANGRDGIRRRLL